MRGEKPDRHASPLSSAARRVLLATGALLAGLIAAASAGDAVSLQWHTQVSDADFFVSGGPGDLLASSMAAGFYNGDNRSDLVFCSTTNNSCWLYYGRDISGPQLSLGAPDITFVGPNGLFGASAAFLGDLNGDGFEDLGIGASGAVGELNAPGGGTLWIFFGRNDSFRGSIGFYDAATTVFGAGQDDAMGAAAAPAGDVDRDGFGDFWVSAPNASDGGVRVGEVLLFRGRASWPAELYRANAALRLTGASAAGEFGRVLLGKVDLNGDGRFDLATSSSRYRDAYNASVGAAFAFMGPFATDGRTVNATRANITFWGDPLAPSLGSSLTFAPNFTKERGPILIIGAPVYTNNTSTGGSLHLFKITGSGCCRVQQRWDEVGLLYTTEANDQAGISAASGADINHDGFFDLLIGAPTSEVTNRIDAGRVYIVYGNDTSRQPLLLNDRQEGLEGKANGTQLGHLVQLADFNGDGFADLIVTSPGENRASPQTGIAYGFVGRPRNRAPEVKLTTQGNRTEGTTIDVFANISDADGDRLSWEWTGMTDNGNHKNQAIVSVVYPDEGLEVITIVVFDGTLFAYARVELNILNVAPSCNITAVAPFVEGRAGTLALEVFDPGGMDQWTYEWGGPDGLYYGGPGAVYEPRRGHPFSVNVTTRDEDGGVGFCFAEIEVSNVAPNVTIIGASSMWEGDTAQYKLELSDPGVEDEFFVNWSGPDGTDTDAVFSFRPVRPGLQVIEARVEDLDGGVAYAKFNVVVKSISPDVALIFPTSATEGDTIVFEVRQYSGQAFDPLNILWDIHPLGHEDENLYRITAAVTGEYGGRVIVADDDYDVVAFNVSVTVTNREPLEGIRARPPPPYREGQRITLDAVVGSWETTPTAYIQYAWTLDNESIGNERSVGFFAVAGRHVVQVTAWDRELAYSHFTLRVEVENSPPVVTIEGHRELIPGAIGTWHAEASDASGLPVSLSWDVDGVQVAEGPELLWGSPSQGSHIVRVTARDASGQVSVATMLIAVTPPPARDAGIDLRWAAVPLGAMAAFAAGILMGAWVIGRIREGRRQE